MPALTLPINSTNVRNAVSVAWLRLNMRITATLAPRKAVDTAARLFTTPPRFAHTPRELELLSTGTRYDVRTAHGTLAAWRFGRGETRAYAAPAPLV